MGFDDLAIGTGELWRISYTVQHRNALARNFNSNGRMTHVLQRIGLALVISQGPVGQAVKRCS